MAPILVPDKHSPTPWKSDKGYIFDANGKPLPFESGWKEGAMKFNGEAVMNQALIVKAVNWYVKQVLDDNDQNENEVHATIEKQVEPRKFQVIQGSKIGVGHSKGTAPLVLVKK
jgi:hypothetical protein